jgi:hypothetical protein
MSNTQNKTKTNTLAPFTQDETIVRKIGNTTYILTAKYKQDAKEGLADKLLRLIKNNNENIY